MVNKLKLEVKKMKKLKKLLPIGCSVLTLFTMSAFNVSADIETAVENISAAQSSSRASVNYDFTYNGGAYKVLNDTYVSFMGVTDSSVKNFNIPSRAVDMQNQKNYIISEIGDPNAYMPGSNSGLMNLETIGSVPGSVTTVNNFAFYGGKLKSINLSGLMGLNKINYSAFANCAQLQTVKLPCYLTTIENSAFAGCTSLINFSISSDGKGECTLNKICAFAFSNCSKLRLLNIPFSTSMTIEDNAFANMSATAAKPVEIALGTPRNAGYYYGYIKVADSVIEQLKNKTLCFTGDLYVYKLNDMNGNELNWNGTIV